jgi:MFS family permease
MAWLWRIFHVPLVILPLLPWPNDVRLAILIGCIFLAGAMAQVMGPTYNDWLGEIIPSNSRGWYFSRRTLIATVCGALTGLMGGFALDVFKGGALAEVSYSFIFGFGVLLGLVSMGFFLRMGDLPRANPVPPNLGNALRQMSAPFRDVDFRKVLIFAILFTTSSTLAGNLFSAYAIESLDMPLTVLTATGVAHAIGTIAAVKIWGFLSDKYGNKPLLILLLMGIVLTPLMWVACQPGQQAMNAAILLVGHLGNGVLWSGIAVTQLNLYLATAKDEDRANYLGAVLALQAIVGGIAPLLGGAMMASLRTGFDATTSYKIVFASLILFRVLSVLSLIPIREKGATSLRDTLQQITQVKPKGVAALRKIRAGSGESIKEEAMKSIGAAQMTLATADVEHALEDPSPRVRRQAANALGKIGTSEAAEALLRHVEKNPALVDEEMLEALGDAPSKSSVPTLIKFLEHPSSLVRRSAAKALGRIGDPECVEPLALAATQTNDTDLRRAALQALRDMEAKTVPEVFADGLFDPRASIRTAAAEAVSELELKELRDEVRRSLEWYMDEDCCEIAYALACVGDEEDIPIVLQAAEIQVHATQRRRCLLGVARLMGVEGQVYRLMSLSGIARDDALLTHLKPSLKKAPVLAQSLEAFSQGDEPEALAILAMAAEEASYVALAQRPIEEAFIVAAVAFSESEPTTS